MNDLNRQHEYLTTRIKKRPVVYGVTRTRAIVLMTIGAILIALFAGLYWRAQVKLSKVQKQAQQQSANPVVKVQEESQQLIDQIGKLIILPSNEQPTIATVNDLSKLAGQPFFANAKLGDKVLIYTKAQKAILFRPSENRIVELAPLNTGAASTQGSAPSSPQHP